MRNVTVRELMEDLVTWQRGECLDPRVWDEFLRPRVNPSLMPEPSVLRLPAPPTDPLQIDVMVIISVNNKFSIFFLEDAVIKISLLIFIVIYTSRTIQHQPVTNIVISICSLRYLLKCPRIEDSYRTQCFRQVLCCHGNYVLIKYDVSFYRPRT